MSDETAAVEATRESPDDAKTKQQLVAQWLDAIAIASDDEKPWRETQADDAVRIYRQGRPGRFGDGASLNDDDRTFNILHANVETIVPSIYNSTPSPDVRRRFNDNDPAGKQVADILERALSYSVDAYDFDAAIRATVYDMELAGRGVDRVRYVPYLNRDESAVDYEEVQCEHVPWRHFRRGPARMWADVPWVAFELFLTRDELTKLSPKLGGKVKMDAEVERADKRDGQNIPDIYKRARVWEIWDRESKRVLFIATGYKEGPIRQEDDPLGLQGFFPIPRPLYAVETSDSLVPVTPYSVYRDQAEELERVSRRIMAIVEQVKVRAAYDGSLGHEIAKLTNEDDGALVPVSNVANYATTGAKGLENAFAWWPIEQPIIALKQLYEQREQIKQAIYEITGIADIMRGQTDASETLGAQQLKTQWGSLRVQRKQAEVQRYVRDLFRLKAEIIATKFKPETIQLMTGVALDEQTFALLRNDAARGFRVDIESDSTIRADLTRNQQNMNMFLQGTAQYGAAMGPIVQQMPGAMEAVVQIYQAFARNFKLGKQAEDVIEKLGMIAQQSAQQPKPDPEMQKMQAEMQMKQAELQMQQQSEAAKLQLEQAKAQQQAQLDQAKLAADIELEKVKLQAQIELEQQKTQAQLAMEGQKMQMQGELDREKAANDVALKRETSAIEGERKQRESEANIQLRDREIRASMASQGLKEADSGDIMPMNDEALSRANELIEQTARNNERLAQISEQQLQVSAALAEAINSLSHAMSAPRRIVRDAAGRVSHSEVMSQQPNARSMQ